MHRPYCVYLFALAASLTFRFAAPAQPRPAIIMPFLTGRLIGDHDLLAALRSSGTRVGSLDIPVEVRLVCDGRTFASTVVDRNGIGAFGFASQTANSRQRAGGRALTRAGVAGCIVRAFLPGFRSDSLSIPAKLDRDIGTIALHQSEGLTGVVVSATSSSAPRDARKFFDQARDELRFNDLTRVAGSLQRAVDLYPQYAQAWLDLGELQEPTDIGSARASYQKAIAADPTYLLPYQQLIRLETWQAAWDEVFDTASRVLKLCPHDYPEAWYDLAFAADQLKRHAEAEQIARKGIAEDPDRAAPELERLLGSILAAKGDRVGAVEHLQNYLKWCPIAPDVAYIDRQLTALSSSAAIPSVEGGSIAQLVASVRSDLHSGMKDDQAAKNLRNAKLAERLDDRTIETLESEGAGKQTGAELLRLRDETVRKPWPASPAVPMPTAPSLEEQDRIWKAAAGHSIGYTESLPNFICTEVVRRYREADEKPYDNLQVKLSYFDHKENYQLVAIDGSATRLSYEQAGGAKTKGEFGSILASTFSNIFPTEYHWDHWTTLRKRPTHVFFFRIANAAMNLRSEFRMLVPGRLYSAKASQHGFVYVDAETGKVMRIFWEAENIPLDFPMQTSATRLDYDFLEIGGSSYLLPIAAQVLIDSPGNEQRNEVEFRDYGRFAADASITFDTVKK